MDFTPYPYQIQAQNNNVEKSGLSKPSLATNQFGAIFSDPLCSNLYKSYDSLTKSCDWNYIWTIYSIAL